MYLTVAPALVGVLTVAALAYWGQYEHRVPTLVLIAAALATAGTLVLGWLNARYVAERVERLAAGHVSAQPDELDAIETVVDRLSDAVAVAESGKADRERAAVERTQDYAALMATIADDVAKSLEEVRLPLHILLENRFGELNDNQEEMLGAARGAADAADAEIVALRELADLDRGARTLRRDRILPGDLIQALVPTLLAQAEKNGVTLHVDIEPLVPAIWGDRPQLQAALSTLTNEIVSKAQGREITLRLASETEGCVISVHGGPDLPRSVRAVLAARIVELSRGSVRREDGGVAIAFTAIR